MLVQQPPKQNIDTLKSMISTEMLRYKTAIGRDAPFREARKIKKHINKLKELLAKQEKISGHANHLLSFEHPAANFSAVQAYRHKTNADSVLRHN